jgi:opine dehydrogenase
MYGRGSHDRLTDSGDWRERIVLTAHRYMLEDTRIGLSFPRFLSVSSAGVATPAGAGLWPPSAARSAGRISLATGRS